jgi:hypothetical protein
MQLSKTLADHLRSVYTGGNWTWSNIRDQLSGVSLEMAVKKINSLNTIAALVYHINYYVKAQLKVLQGSPLDSSDKFSFNHPEFGSEQEWQQFLQQIFMDAEALALEIERFPEGRLWTIFVNEKYGTWYRNFHGMIEHTHYHLGQIAIIKKMLKSANNGIPGSDTGI